MRSHKTRSTRDPSIPGSLQKYGFPRNPRSHSCRFLILYFEVIYIYSVYALINRRRAQTIFAWGSARRTAVCYLASGPWGWGIYLLWSIQEHQRSITRLAAVLSLPRLLRKGAEQSKHQNKRNDKEHALHALLSCNRKSVGGGGGNRFSLAQPPTTWSILEPHLMQQYLVREQKKSKKHFLHITGYIYLVLQ